MALASPCTSTLADKLFGPQFTLTSCEEFASRGCIVYATARRLEALQDFTQGNIHTLALDVNNDENVQDVVKTVIEREGKIDVLVNNAGVGHTGKS